MNPVERVARGFDDWQQRHAVMGFPIAVVKKFGDDQAGYLVSLLAYYAFVAVFPLLLALTAVTGVVLRDHPKLQGETAQLRLRRIPHHWRPNPPATRCRRLWSHHAVTDRRNPGGAIRRTRVRQCIAEHPEHVVGGAQGGPARIPAELSARISSGAGAGVAYRGQRRIEHRRSIGGVVGIRRTDSTDRQLGCRLGARRGLLHRFVSRGCRRTGDHPRDASCGRRSVRSAGNCLAARLG